jgi:hypothetical protein
MSRLLNFFRRAPNRPLTTAEFLVDAGITAVAVYSSFALIAHHVVAAAVCSASISIPPLFSLSSLFFCGLGLLTQPLSFV